MNCDLSFSDTVWPKKFETKFQPNEVINIELVEL